MIIHRSIFKELITNLIVIVGSLSILLFMEKFVRLTRLFMGKGTDISDVVKIFWYLQPSLLLLSVPTAILIAVFLTYGRMSTDSELVVLKASGMSFLGTSRAAILLSVLLCIVLLFVSLYVLPRSMSAFKKTLHETIVRKASTTFEEETFSDVFKGTVIYVKEIHEKEFRGIFVYRESEKSVEKPVVIVAERGGISSNPEEGLIKLSMKQGLVHTFEGNSSSRISFSEYDFVLTTGLGSIETTQPDEISTADLWNGRKNNVPWEIEFHRRLVLPFACIIFGVLGPALSNRIGKIGRMGGFSLSLSILMLYYLLLVTGEALAEANKIPAPWGAWGPNIIFGLVAFLFFYLAYKDIPIKKF